MTAMVPGGALSFPIAGRAGLFFVAGRDGDAPIDAILRALEDARERLAIDEDGKTAYDRLREYVQVWMSVQRKGLDDLARFLEPDPDEQQSTSGSTSSPEGTVEGAPLPAGDGGKGGDSAGLVERARAHASLLRAYGDIRNDPTQTELWVGCKDAAPILDECADALEVPPLTPTESTRLDAILALLNDDPDGAITVTARTLCAFVKLQTDAAVARAEKAEAERDEALARAGFGLELLDRAVLQGGCESWDESQLRDWCCDYKDFKNGYAPDWIRAHADHKNCAHRHTAPPGTPLTLDYKDRAEAAQRERDEARAENERLREAGEYIGVALQGYPLHPAARTALLRLGAALAPREESTEENSSRRAAVDACPPDPEGPLSTATQAGSTSTDAEERTEAGS